MPLLVCKHDDLLSAALSVANSRATKAARMREEGLAAIADRYAQNLFHDVREFVAYEYAQKTHGEQVPDNVCERLHAAVARARGFYPGPWAVPAPTDLGVIHGPFRDFPVDTL